MKKTGTSSPKAEKAVGTKKTAAKRVSAAAKTGTAKKAQKAAPAAEEKIPEKKQSGSISDRIVIWISSLYC